MNVVRILSIIGTVSMIITACFPRVDSGSPTPTSDQPIALLNTKEAIRVTTSLEPDNVTFYLIIEDDGGKSGPAVGCGDSAVLVKSDRILSINLEQNVKTALEELFSIKSPQFGDSGFNHSLHSSSLKVIDVVPSDNSLTINIRGELSLLGVCADARMEAQITMTVFQFSGFEQAFIYINESNLKDVFDLSGTIEDVPYLRFDIDF